MKKWTFPILLSILILTGCLSAKVQWMVVPDEPGSEYLILPPKSKSKTGIALCMAFHGYGGDCASYGRLWHGALKGKYMVVAPQGPSQWRKGKAVSTWRGTRDLEYAEKIFDAVQKKWDIDPAKTVLVGYSAGGSMVRALGKSRKDLVAALVFHGASPGKIPNSLKDEKIFLLAGSKDKGFGPAGLQSAFQGLRSRGFSVQSFVVQDADHASVYAHVQPAAKWILAGFSSE